MSAELGPHRRCAVLGSPIAHSLSPVLHRAAYAALGLDWEYDAHEVTEATLPGFLAGLDPAYRGLSLTMPLKSAVIPFCTRVSGTAAALQSVNTLLLEPDGSRSGHNTDVPGCIAALAEAGVSRVESAVLVGSGATAASALAAVAGLGAARVEVLARTVAMAGRLVPMGADLGVSVTVTPLPDADIVAAADLVVSTIPATAQPEVLDALTALAPTVFDVIYEPARTPLLAAAERAGLTTVPGFALLLHQAARQVELMTGCDEAPVEAMRAAGLAALADRP